MAEMSAAGQMGEPAQRGKRIIYRHAVLVRMTHWINVLCLAILLMSGLQIFNAHPALYWGQASDFARPIFSIYDNVTDAGRPVGMTHIFGRDFTTTGVLGWSTYNDQPGPRGFPAWITIPSYQDLATGRVWHFFFAWLFAINGFVYLLYTFLGRHFSNDLLPGRDQLRHIGDTIRNHLRLKFPRGEEAAQYNVIQKLTYLLVILVFLPLVVLTGLTMSPGMDAALPWLLDLFGGRQSARTIHFIIAWLLVSFVLVHVFMVLVSGVFNNLRSMISGWYSIVQERSARDDKA